MQHLTAQQNHAVSLIAEGNSHVAVQSPAGSGKTTMLVAAVHAYLERKPTAKVLNAAFSTRIAAELEDRMPPGCINLNFNKLGHRAWQRRFGNKRLNVQVKWGGNEKIYEHMKAIGIKRPKSGEDDPFADLPRLVHLAKAGGMRPEGAPVSMMKGGFDEDPAYWQHICDVHSLDYSEELINAARQVFVDSIRSGLKGTIDFSDQIYMPAMFSFPKQHDFDLILIDEYQDTDPIQQQFIHRLASPKTIIGIIGDPRQSIFLFRGAHDNAFSDAITELCAEEATLTYSFRCGSSIIAEAQKIVGAHYIEAPPNAPEGLVRRPDSIHISELNRECAVLCRNTAPLIDLFYKCVKGGVPARIVGTSIGKGLVTHLKKIAPPSTSVTNMPDAINKYREVQYKKLLDKQQPLRARQLVEHMDILLTVASRTKGTNKDMQTELMRMFTDKIPRVALSTIHKAKGLEWPVVYFLDRHLIPSKYAKTKPQLLQEENLIYVAVTRAKEELVYIDSENIDDACHT